MYSSLRARPVYTWRAKACQLRIGVFFDENCPCLVVAIVTFPGIKKLTLIHGLCSNDLFFTPLWFFSVQSGARSFAQNPAYSQMSCCGVKHITQGARPSSWTTHTRDGRAVPPQLNSPCSRFLIANMPYMVLFGPALPT